MPQMVLPQAPAPAGAKETGSSKPVTGKDAGGESRYESVSRAEQERTERKRSERSEASQAKDEPRESETSRNDESVESPSDASATSETKHSENRADQATAKPGSVDEEAETTGDELTFVNLQTLLSPVTGEAKSAEGSAVKAAATEMSTPGGQQMAAKSLLGGPNAGKPGQAGQSLPGVTQGLQLQEMISGSQGAESSRPVDASSLVASARFQGALEVASQAAGNQAAKVATEAAIPLRSYTTSIDLPVGHTEWGDKVVGKLSFLTARNMSVAEIHLTPPDMGPMEVKVKVHNEQANITVHAANPVVRDQLELNSHRLRDMLGEQGLSLAQFDVSDSPQQQTGEQSSGGEGQAAGGSGLASGVTESEAGITESGSLDLSWKGEVDVFA